VFKKNKLVFVIVLIVIAMVTIAGVYLTINNTNGDNGNDTPEGNPIAVFDTTKGTMKVELYKDKLPNTVGNFVKLVNDGFYDGMIFHRVKDDFMIQAGRYFPDGSEKQSPYGSIDLETHPDVKHIDGAISMGQKPGDPNSASSEFFICDEAQRSLDDDFLADYGQRGYAAFGKVIEGIDVIRAVASTEHDGSLDYEGGAGGGKPLTDIVINSITIE